MLHEELFDGTHNQLDGTQPFPPVAERMSVLAIAYHNMGVEQEFLSLWEQALLSYNRAMQLARLHVGEEHLVTATFSQTYEKAKRSLARKIKERGSRRVVGAEQRMGRSASSSTPTPRRSSMVTSASAKLNRPASAARPRPASGVSTLAPAPALARAPQPASAAHARRRTGIE
mmetsp:Transcript_16309/g.41573  ORF Transcript_16309/g.41573 Transcript_16309/m.41573 type:complete len:173 (+) Transcript_16309:129-647(+)